MDDTPRTILVTGATGGIGRAVCQRLAEGGARLLLSARVPARPQSLRAKLPARGTAEHGWVSVEMTLDASVQQVADVMGGRTLILDDAVLMPPKHPATADALPSSEKWPEVLQNSFGGPPALLKAAIGAMRPELAQGQCCDHTTGHKVLHDGGFTRAY